VTEESNGNGKEIKGTGMIGNHNIIPADKSHN